jgi:hypothetical protein
MKKERTEERVIDQTYYDFYCNSCGKLINSSMECDDGDHYIFGETKGKLKLSSTETNKTIRLQFRTELCAECFNSMVSEMDIAIKDVLQKYGVTDVATSRDDKKNKEVN